MPKIHLTTFIGAAAEVVFDLSRHITLYKESMAPYKQEAVAGTRFGLIEKGDTVTWRSHHLFKERLQRVKYIELQRPDVMIEVQLQGDLASLRHEHYFKSIDNGMLLIDLLEFEMPYGSLGRLFNSFYFTGYMESLLHRRNETIKRFAETDRWKKILIK
ncbi:MAG: SRPBCC family protein [Sphingomonadales bacterium]|jgi:ligand-binding SRPBCC domain-containing protein|nr:SRPBCC family protein [Sphingomonadales bacterium]